MCAGVVLSAPAHPNNVEVPVKQIKCSNISENSEGWKTVGYQNVYLPRCMSNHGVNEELIGKETQISITHLTPEIKLHLITPECRLWHSKDEKLLLDPFWAFYWPGGQVVSRLLLDNHIFSKNKNILDFGCGCGACGLSAIMCKAKKVIFNDIDPVALLAVSRNAEINGLSVEDLVPENLIGDPCQDIDTILVGDMLYDSQFANEVLRWLQSLSKSGKSVLIGDPGRFALESHPMKDKMKCRAKYRLPPHTILENNGHVDGFVWTFR